jgi:hypothetical protein
MNDPIKESIKYLVECGWSEDQAKNLIRAVKSDQSAEHLWEVAPQWIEHCGERMRYVSGVLESVAMGLVDVRIDENGEWLFSLNDTGLDVGKQLQEDE